MIDKEKRNKEINETFENKFTRLLEQCKGQEGWQLFVDTIIAQEQSMIAKLEADKAELLDMLKQNRKSWCDICKMNESFECTCVGIARLDRLIEKMEK